MYIFISISVFYDHFLIFFKFSCTFVTSSSNWNRVWGLGGNPLLPNSSETAWNFETPFYRKEDGSMRMVYVYFHKPIYPL